MLLRGGTPHITPIKVHSTGREQQDIHLPPRQLTVNPIAEGAVEQLELTGSRNPPTRTKKKELILHACIDFTAKCVIILLVEKTTYPLSRNTPKTSPPATS